MYLISINVDDKDSAWMNETRNLQKIYSEWKI